MSSVFSMDKAWEDCLHLDHLELWIWGQASRFWTQTSPAVTLSLLLGKNCFSCLLLTLFMSLALLFDIEEALWKWADLLVWVLENTLFLVSFRIVCRERWLHNSGLYNSRKPFAFSALDVEALLGCNSPARSALLVQMCLEAQLHVNIWCVQVMNDPSPKCLYDTRQWLNT